MKKKHILVIAGICLTVGMTACGSSKGSEGEAVTEELETAIDAKAALEFTTEKYVTLGEYQNLAVDKVKAEVSQEELEEQIQALQDENTTYEPVTDRAAAEGDQVTVIYSEVVEGEEIAASDEEGDEVVLGDGYYGETFETEIVGMKIGETKTFTETLSEDEYDETLAGKEAEYTVTLQEIDKVIVPEYNDELVASATDFAATAEYEADLKEELLAQAEESANSQAAQMALSLAMENAEVTGCPDTLYEACYQETLSYYQSTADMFGMDLDTFLSDFAGTDQSAIQTESQSFAYQIVAAKAIADLEGMDVSVKALQAQADEQAELYGYESGEELIEDNGEFTVYASFLIDQVGNRLLETAKINELTQAEYDQKYAEEEAEEGSTEELIPEDTESL